jgi:ABC-type iron transport system FetAB ATPase subunit
MTFEHITIGTTTRGLSSHVPVAIDPDARARHTVIFGQTGTGKSVLLRNICAQIAAQAGGFAFLDASRASPAMVRAREHRAGRAMTARRFPPPWTVIKNAESFWVQDAGRSDRRMVLLPPQRGDRPPGQECSPETRRGGWR